jgi:segregation and condensation protein B
VEAIRGVDSSNSLRNLIGEGYLRVVGKKELPGRPQTYGTTEKFLRYFGLSSLEELPRIEDLKEMFDEN